jgi:hypothetical protein
MAWHGPCCIPKADAGSNVVTLKQCYSILMPGRYNIAILLVCLPESAEVGGPFGTIERKSFDSFPFLAMNMVMQ